MRSLGNIFGGLLVALGLLSIWGGCGIAAVNSGGYVAVWFGVAMTAAGLLICNAASKKICPTCQERVKAKAVKCKHCGSIVDT